MRRFFHRSGRKRHDGGAVDKSRHQPCDNAHNKDASQASTVPSVPERVPRRTDKDAFLSPGAPAPAPTPATAAIQSPPAPSSNHTSSATTPQDDAHEAQPDTSPSSPSATKKDYWQLATEVVQKEDSSLGVYIAEAHQAAVETGITDFAARLLNETKKGQAALEAKRWKITTSKGEVVIRHQLDRLVKVVTAYKGIITTVGTVDPVHAGLPLAGFCVLMQASAPLASAREQEGY